MDSLEQQLRHQSMDWLARREYSCHELAQKLERRFFGPHSHRFRSSKATEMLDDTAITAAETSPPAAAQQLIQATLAWLQERQFLSDERCARLYVRSHIERGHGPLRIRQQLILIKRLPEDLVVAAMDASDCDWFALAQTTLVKRFRQPPADLKEKARQLRFLQQRGFTSDQCFHALERLEQADN